MSDLKKFFIYTAFEAAAMIVAVLVPIYLYLGLTIEQALQVVLVYKLTMAIAEVPTGVVGDRYGHKVSVLIGIFIMSLVLLGWLLLHGFIPMLVLAVIFGIGLTFQSGSNLALLHSLSNDYKRDLAKHKYISLTALMLSSIVAGFAFTLHPLLPVLITLIFKIISFIVLLTIHDPARNESEEHAKQRRIKEIMSGSVAILRTNKTVTAILTGLGLLVAVSMQFKYLTNTIFEVRGFSNMYIGIYYTLLVASQIIGSLLSKNIHIKWHTLWMILIFLLALAAFVPFKISLGIFLIIIMLIQVVEIDLKTDLLRLAGKNQRATLLSTASLFTNLTYSIMLLMMGYFAGRNALNMYLVILVVLNIVLVLYNYVVAAREK